MSDSATDLPSNEPPNVPTDAHADVLPEELPPVEPPSAGFIIQLFVVPGIIVLVIVGLWALFGQLSLGKQDWQRLLTDLKSDNPHRSWRAAYGLAHVLQTDLAKGEKGEQLSKNPKIAEGLTALFEQKLASTNREEETLTQQEFLARTLGYSDVHATVVPALLQSIQPKHERELRKVSLASLSMIAGRADESGNSLTDEKLVTAIIETSSDGDELIRQMSAFALGLLPTKEAKQRLLVLLEDRDKNTRLNAAIGLVRQGSTDGLSIFHQVLKDAGRTEAERFTTAEGKRLQKEELEAAKVQEFLGLKNTLKALNSIVVQLTDSQRAETVALLEPIVEDYKNPQIGIDARKVLISLREME